MKDMSDMKREIASRFACVAGILIFVLFLAGCYAPSPLYGTWVDNSGDSLRFLSDGSYVLKLAANSQGRNEEYKGSYTVIDNVITFTAENGAVRVTEWDIRGSILYLDWTDSTKVTHQLTLYHSER